jgi:hypothetical protein
MHHSPDARNGGERGATCMRLGIAKNAHGLVLCLNRTGMPVLALPTRRSARTHKTLRRVHHAPKSSRRGMTRLVWQAPPPEARRSFDCAGPMSGDSREDFSFAIALSAFFVDQRLYLVRGFCDHPWSLHP